MGQTGWSLKQPYFEHIRYIWYNNPQSAYTNHILQQAHKYEPIQNTMTLIHPASTGCLMDILEQFFIKKNTTMSTCWFRSKYLVKITPCLHSFMILNYNTLLLELVLASSLIFQIHHVIHYTLLTKLICIKNFCHTIHNIINIL
jgi:hypothetical protein